MVSRWHDAVASRSGAEPWDTIGKGMDKSKPSRVAGGLLRYRVFGVLAVRLLLSLLSVFLVALCFNRLRSQGQLVAHSSIQKLSWDSMTQAPRVLDGALSAVRPPVGLGKQTTEVCVMFPEALGIDTATATKLPYIPSKIWQVYLGFKARGLSPANVHSWLRLSPSYMYSVLDDSGALGVVGRLAAMAASGSWKVSIYPKPRGDAGAGTGILRISNLDFAQDVMQQYVAMYQNVLRVDFLRYLILALEGGVYSDVDTFLERQIQDWVPLEHRSHTRLIVGLEADSTPPVPGTKYEVQFCQWTLAATPDHPAMWTMVDRILSTVRELPQDDVPQQKVRKRDNGETSHAGGDDYAAENGELKQETPKQKPKHKPSELTDEDVFEISGPIAWTEVVFEHLNSVAGEGVGQEKITWLTLTGLTEPRLFGDTLVLPIDSFATGVPHSGASVTTTEQTLVQHQFHGKWKVGEN